MSQNAAEGYMQMSATSPSGPAPMGVIGVDVRMSGRRRHREILNGLLASIGGSPTVDVEQRCRRVAGLCIWLEQREAEIERGVAINMNELVRVSNLQARLMRDLGLSAPRRRS